VTTVLFYFVIAAVIGLVIFFLVVFVFGRGEQMAPLDPRTSPAELPDHDITSEDVRKIRFSLALRGYRMSDVDWTLERLGDQLDVLRRENAELRGETSDPEAAPAESRVPVGVSAWQIGNSPTRLEPTAPLEPIAPVPPLSGARPERGIGEPADPPGQDESG
jgi:DivIVA domain-containing protein